MSSCSLIKTVGCRLKRPKKRNQSIRKPHWFSNWWRFGLAGRRLAGTEENRVPYRSDEWCWVRGPERKWNLHLKTRKLFITAAVKVYPAGLQPVCSLAGAELDDQRWSQRASQCVTCVCYITGCTTDSRNESVCVEKMTFHLKIIKNLAHKFDSAVRFT